MWSIIRQYNVHRVQKCHMFHGILWKISKQIYLGKQTRPNIEEKTHQSMYYLILSSEALVTCVNSSRPVRYQSLVWPHSWDSSLIKSDFVTTLLNWFTRKNGGRWGGKAGQEAPCTRVWGVWHSGAPHLSLWGHLLLLMQVAKCGYG